MEKKTIVNGHLLVLTLVILMCCSSAFAANAVPTTQPASTTLPDVQKIVRAENDVLMQQFNAKFDQTEKNIEQKTVDFANRIMGDFIKIIEDAEKKVILIASLSIAGLILLIEGILGYIRIKLERNALQIMKKDIDYFRKDYEDMKVIIVKLEEDIKKMKTPQVIIQKVMEGKTVAAEPKLNPKELAKQKKIEQLKKELEKLGVKEEEKKEPELEVPVPAQPQEPVPAYPRYEIKKGWFGIPKKALVK
jgi:hypothetical protein